MHSNQQLCQGLCAEINGLGNRALRIAQEALDDIEEDNTLTEEEIKNAEIIVSIIRECIVDWKERLGQGEF